MFPVILPINEKNIKLCYKNIVSVKISHVCRLDIYFKRHVVDVDKEILELHFLDNLHEWYSGTVIEYDANKSGVELLYDILSYAHYIAMNHSNLICDYTRFASRADNEDLDIEVWFNMDRSKLLHDLITVGEFKTFDKGTYKFTHPLKNIEDFLSPLTTLDEKEEVNG